MVQDARRLAQVEGQQVRPEWDAALRRADEAGWDRHHDAAVEALRAAGYGNDVIAALASLSYDDHAPRHEPGS